MPSRRPVMGKSSSPFSIFISLLPVAIKICILFSISFPVVSIVDSESMRSHLTLFLKAAPVSSSSSLLGMFSLLSSCFSPRHEFRSISIPKYSRSQDACMAGRRRTRSTSTTLRYEYSYYVLYCCQGPLNFLYSNTDSQPSLNVFWIITFSDFIRVHDFILDNIRKQY